MRNGIKWRPTWRIPGLILAVLAVLAVAGCSDPFSSDGGASGDSGGNTASASDDPPRQVVPLDPGRAEIRGAAQNRCWDGECYWVVWCGHNICDGSWTWTFPSSGDYQITWEGVKEKCAGSPAYEVRINGRTVADGRVPRHGSCSGCDGSGRFVDRELGTFELEEGDAVTLWVENHFACGIDGPGAYAAHDALRADPQ